jgi:hypothetical protein
MPLQIPTNRPLPDDLLRAIGRLATEWALIEDSLEQLLWHLLGITITNNVGRAITTHIPFRTRIDIARSYTRQRKMDPQLIMELDKLLVEIDKKRGERNAYVHARWDRYPAQPHTTAHTFAAHRELEWRTQNVTAKDVEKVADDIIVLNGKLTDLGWKVHNATFAPPHP